MNRFFTIETLTGEGFLQLNLRLCVLELFSSHFSLTKCPVDMFMKKIMNRLFIIKKWDASIGLRKIMRSTRKIRVIEQYLKVFHKKRNVSREKKMTDRKAQIAQLG